MHVPASRLGLDVGVDVVGRKRRLRGVVDEVVQEDLAREHGQIRQHDSRPGHADHVAEVRAGPHPDVLERVGEGAATLGHALADRGEARLEQDDVGRGTGDVRGVVDADAHVGHMQSRRVIDAVAHVADDVPRLAQGADDLELLVGIDAGKDRGARRAGHQRGVGQPAHLVAGQDFVDLETDEARDVAGHQVIVAGDDLERDSLGRQCRDRRADVRLGRVAE